MAWLKGVHIATLALWSASLFYLPLLLADCRAARGPSAIRRAQVMARATFVMIASPAAVLAISTGTWLAYAGGAGGMWLVVKLTVVALMVVFHLNCGRLVTRLDDLPRMRRAGRLSWLTCVPAVLVTTVVWLALAKPF